MTPKIAFRSSAIALAALLMAGGGLAFTTPAFAADEVITNPPPSNNPYYPPYDGGDECNGECGGPIRGCDNESLCGGIETPFAAPDAISPIAGVPDVVNIEPPSDEEDEAKIGNAPITGSGNSDLIRAGRSGR